MPVRLLYCIFFASGFAGLIYESIWSHYLKLFLGHAAYAQTLVLAIFMGGMALGAALAARHSERIARPLRRYAWIEAAIGLCALVFHPLFIAATEGFFAFAAAAGLSGAGFTAAKWALAVGLILPQSVLLGMTFPLFAAAATRRQPSHEGRSVATLYFANSLGGAIGVLASGFMLIPLLGLPGTILMAGVTNLLIAGATLRLSAQDQRASSPASSPATATTHTNAPPPDRLIPLMLVVAFLTGASSFVYEVGWIRMLSLVLGSATHSFELMLSCMILGLALGGLWVRRHADRAAPGILLGYIQIAMGLAAVATIPLHNLSFDLIARAMQALPPTDAGYVGFNLVRYGIACLIMLPAAFCAGMTLPLATRILFSRRDQGERAIGRIYSANTVGAICGIAFAMHVGLPVLGLEYLVATGAMIDVLLGGALLLVFAGGARTRQIIAATLACTAGTVFGAASVNPQKLASGVFRTGSASTEGEVFAIEHGKTATISVERLGDKITIRTNGKPDAAARLSASGPYAMDEVTMTLIGAVPLLLHDTPGEVANIGFGSGMTGATLLDDPRVARLDTIEIEPAMVRLARHYGPVNRAVFEDPRSRIHFDDAKSFFASDTQRRYDVIVSEPSNPWVSGVAGLFSVEFYRHVKRYLKQDGLFAQWLQIYEMHPDRAASVIKAVAESFDDYLIVALDYGNILIVARPDGRVTLDPDAFARLSPPLRERLARLQILSAADITLRLLANKALLAPWLAQQAPPANSDFTPYLDSYADRDRFVRADWNEVFTLGIAAYPVAELLRVRPPLATPSCVTVNEHFGNGSPITDTRISGQALLNARASSPCPTTPSPSAPHLLKGFGILEACRTPTTADLGYGAGGVARVLAHFSPNEGRAILTGLDGAPCLNRALPGVGEWPQLLTAIAARDPAGIAQAADALLAAGQGLTEIRAHYLLTMAMLGHLAAGDRQAANASWARHSLSQKPPDAMNFVLQVLLAQANAPGGAPDYSLP